MSKSKEKKPAEGTRTFYIKGVIHKNITPEQYKELTGTKPAPVLKK